MGNFRKDFRESFEKLLRNFWRNSWRIFWSKIPLGNPMIHFLKYSVENFLNDRWRNYWRYSSENFLKIPEKKTTWQFLFFEDIFVCFCYRIHAGIFEGNREYCPQISFEEFPKKSLLKFLWNNFYSNTRTNFWCKFFFLKNYFNNL